MSNTTANRRHRRLTNEREFNKKSREHNYIKFFRNIEIRRRRFNHEKNEHVESLKNKILKTNSNLASKTLSIISQKVWVIQRRSRNVHSFHRWREHTRFKKNIILTVAQKLNRYKQNFKFYERAKFNQKNFIEK